MCIVFLGAWLIFVCIILVFTVGFELEAYSIHEAEGLQTVCVTSSDELDNTNVSIMVSSLTDGATAQGNIKCPILSIIV